MSTGRLLHCNFRGLLSVHSRYGLHARKVAKATSYTGGFSGFVTSTAAPIATGWSDPVPGRDLHPLWTNAFARRTTFLLANDNDSRGSSANNAKVQHGVYRRNGHVRGVVLILIIWFAHQLS